MMEQANPYATPDADLNVGSVNHAEILRKDYLNHEASIQSVGILYYLGFLMFVIILITMLVAPKDSELGSDLQIATTLLGGGVLCFITVWIGRSLRKLKAQARIPVLLTSLVGLINFPLGTLINGYILWLVFSAKGKMVFSEEYAQVIQQTPHIKYKTPKLIMALGILFFAAIAFVIGAVLLEG
ncbi:MAG: hypothetical protein JRC77_10440 [Deltaproteobacteria bacterium]|nr:hypothetical protein [Deltaproteobacteria bacterium]